MIYILIAVWFGTPSYSGKAALAVEFNNKASGLAAADELRKQSGTNGNVILCAPKGKP